MCRSLSDPGHSCCACDAQGDEILPRAPVTLKWVMVAQSGEVLAFVKLPFQKPAGPFSIGI